MKDESNVIHLSDYLNESQGISIIDKREKDFSALMPKTHLVKRSLSLFLDLSVITILNIGIHNGYNLFVTEFMGPLSSTNKYQLMQGNMGFSLGVFLVIYFSYFLYCTFILNGKTIGKMATGLKVIREEFVHNMESTDYQLDLKDSFRRAMGYLLCYLSFGIFFIFNFASEDKRGLPDYLSGSRTVSDLWLTQMQEYKETQKEQVLIDITQLDKIAA